MAFPRHSHFDRDHHESEREFAQRIEVPVRTPEENQRIAAETPTVATIPVRDLDEIVHNLRNLTLALDIEDAQLESDIEDAADRLASYLPG